MTQNESSSPITAAAGDAAGTLLSSDPDVQAIEIEFLARWLAASDAAAARILQRAREGQGPQTSEELQLVQSALFGELARILEASMRHKDGFSPFGKR